MPSRRRFTLRTLGLALAMTFVLTLGGIRSTAAQNATPPADVGTCTTALGIGTEDDACINVVHVSPDAPNVDVYLDGQLAIANLALGWYGGWVPVAAGEHQVQVTATGAAPDTAVIDATVTVEADMAYQIAATGFLAEITPQIYPVDLGAIEEGNARVRVIHTAPDAPVVDIAVTGGDVLISSLAFPDASDALDIPAGSYDLEVRPAGTTDVVLPLPGTTFEANTVYDVFAFGTLAQGLYVLVVPSPIVAGPGAASAPASCTAALGIGTAGDACVNVVHASPDAPAVDVYLNGQQALAGLAFGQFSGWVAVPAGDYQVRVTAAGGAPEEAVIDAEITIEAGAAYHLAATGLLADIAPQIYQTDLSELDPDTARVRVIHASPDAPAVDIAVASGDVLIKNLAFPDASEAIEVPAGAYDLEVRPAGTADVALDLSGVAFEAGIVYDVFAIGQVSDGSLTVLVVPSATSAPAATPAA